MVDAKTKRRQAAFILVAIIALVLTVLLYQQGAYWLTPALIVYGVLAALVYRGNRQVYLVPVDDENPHDK